MHNSGPDQPAPRRNRLGEETSPYLLQHASNPVDWYPWGAEALERASTEDKPILLSIGYAACHWCHVMAHESFESEETAKLMNEHFVNVKVDREERPDIDSIYMQAVQAMSGQGGWPMTMFLLPDGTPFYGGTYFPPEDRHGLPSFRRVLTSVADAYRDKRESLTQTAAHIADALRTAANPGGKAAAPDKRTLELAYRGLAQHYDVHNSGFGTAPKFPPTMALDFLLRFWKRTANAYALEMARDSFLAMVRGGIYDQVGGGIARYSVDAKWLVPHFEKITAENALLVRHGAFLWQATGDEEVRRAVETTIAWTLREMADHQGGFFSSLDADSEGEEGKFYVWSFEELTTLLGEDSPLIASYWGATQSGNFDGANVLHVATDIRVVASRAGLSVEQALSRIESAKKTLLRARNTRPRPARDEKIVAVTNALMIRALCESARIFRRSDYRIHAEKSGEFLWKTLVKEDRVFRSFGGGALSGLGYLEDYAATGLACINLYQLTFERTWLDRAREICDSVIKWFWDSKANAFFDTASDAEQLIVRPRNVSDNASPAGNSLALELLFLVSEYFEASEASGVMASAVQRMTGAAVKYPTGFGHLLVVLDSLIYGAHEIIVAGEPGSLKFREMTDTLASHFVPALVLAGGNPDAIRDLPLLVGRESNPEHVTAYLCHRRVCELPTTDAAILASQLEKL